MKKLLSAIVVLSLAGAASAQSVELGAGLGYNNGLSIEGTLHAPSALGQAGFRADIGYSKISNEAHQGSNVTLGAGATYPIVRNSRGLDAYVHGGARYSIASVTSKSNANSGISTNAFGIGGGVQLSHPLATNVRLTGDLGVDHFFDAPITLKNGSTIKPGDALYPLSDKILPDTNFKARIGVKSRF